MVAVPRGPRRRPRIGADVARAGAAAAPPAHVAAAAFKCADVAAGHDG